MSPCRNIISESDTDCKYYFQIILKKFPEILLISGKALCNLEQKALSGPGNPALVWFAVYQYDIRTDFFDTVPGNYVVIPASGNTEKTAGARNHDGTEITLGNIDLDIGDEAKPLAGADADDLFALEVSKFHGHSWSLPVYLNQSM